MKSEVRLPQITGKKPPRTKRNGARKDNFPENYGPAYLRTPRRMLGGEGGGAGWLQTEGPVIYCPSSSGGPSAGSFPRRMEKGTSQPRGGGWRAGRMPRSGSVGWGQGRRLPKKVERHSRRWELKSVPKTAGKGSLGVTPSSVPQFPPWNSSQRGQEIVRPGFRAARVDKWSEISFLCRDLHSEVENAAFSGAEAAQAVPLVPQAGFVHLPPGARALALPRE